MHTVKEYYYSPALRLPTLQLQQLQLCSNSPGFYLPRFLIISHDHPAWRSSTLYQGKRRRDRSFVEQPFSFTKNYRVNIQPEFIHQLMLQQQVNKLAATPNLESFSLLMSSMLFRNKLLLQFELVLVVESTYLATSFTPGQCSACWGQ